MKNYGLVADVGGTNVRFALVDLDQPRRVALQAPRKLVSRAYSSILDAAKAYLSSVKADAPLSAAVFAVAGPVHDEEIRLTNLQWRFTASDLQAGLDVGQVHLLNDYEAIAFAVPSLGSEDLLDIGAVSPKVQKAEDRQVIAIVGPGTGLGVAGYVRAPQGVFPLVTEGGHADFAPCDDVEIEILNFLRRRYAHVSAERVLSGSGLVNLHEALSAIEGVAYDPRSSHEITDAAQKDPGSLSARAVGRFCAIMGSVCGNVALTMGARDGVLIAGGILPAMSDTFAASAFRARFEAKGRFDGYMKDIPTRLIVQQYAGLLGAAAVLVSRTATAKPKAKAAVR
jgi:glucokinase